MGTNFYLVENACSHCGRSDEKRHIGKRSGGWKFTWRGYTRVPPFLTTYREWAARIGDPLNHVVDEYGHRYAGHEFLAMVQAWDADPKNTQDHVTYMLDPKNVDLFASHVNYWQDGDGHAFIGEEFA